MHVIDALQGVVDGHLQRVIDLPRHLVRGEIRVVRAPQPADACQRIAQRHVAKRRHDHANLAPRCKRRIHAHRKPLLRAAQQLIRSGRAQDVHRFPIRQPIEPQLVRQRSCKLRSLSARNRRRTAAGVQRRKLSEQLREGVARLALPARLPLTAWATNAASCV